MHLTALEVPPGGAEPHLWADFVELRALIHPDRCFSRGDIVSLAKRVEATASNRTFRPEERWRDLISFAGARRFQFGDAIYPFAVSDDADTLELRDGPLSLGQRSYLLLLLASLLRHVPKGAASDGLTRNFEKFSLKVFEHLMPDGAEVHATGAGGGSGARYKGTLFNKMKALAIDIRAASNFEQRDFKRSDCGDGGIDLVAWHPMADTRKGIPAALAQCGCSKEDWRFKQLEVNYAKLQHKLSVMHPWSSYYFLPLDFRAADGGWANESDLGGTIIVDRLRLLRLAERHQLHAEFPKWPPLDGIMAMSYS